MNFLANNILFIYFFPTLAVFVAFLAHFVKYSISSNKVMLFSIISSLFELIISTSLIHTFIFDKNIEPFSNSISWFNISNLNISLGILIDKFSSVFLLILFIIAIIVQIFSFILLKNDKNINLYFGFVNLLILTMTALILSSNYIQTVILAIIAGMNFYLIMNFHYDKINVSKYAKKFFIIDKFGDFCLLASVFIFIYFINAYELSFNSELLGYKELTDLSANLYVYMSDTNFYSFNSLVLLGIMAKSGIFPFHVKHLLACYQYSPLCYLINFSMAIIAGILTFRLLPVFDLSEKTVYIIFILCAVTVLYSLIYGIINKIFIKKEFSYMAYALLSIMFMVLPITGISHSDYPNSIEKILFILLFIALCYSILTSVLIYIYKKPEYIQCRADKELVFDNVFDWFADNIFDIPRNIIKVVDKNILPILTNSIGYSARFMSWAISVFQNGKIQSYLLYSTLFISMILILYLIFAMGGI
ncbi:hypothetical protein IJG14_02085 [bacterium]|nr:hypothetical protein [bacterium]